MRAEARKGSRAGIVAAEPRRLREWGALLWRPATAVAAGALLVAGAAAGYLLHDPGESTSVVTARPSPSASGERRRNAGAPGRLGDPTMSRPAGPAPRTTSTRRGCSATARFSPRACSCPAATGPPTPPFPGRSTGADAVLVTARAARRQPAADLAAAAAGRPPLDLTSRKGPASDSAAVSARLELGPDAAERDLSRLLPPSRPGDQRLLLQLRAADLPRLHDRRPRSGMRCPECAGQRTPGAADRARGLRAGRGPGDLRADRDQRRRLRRRDRPAAAALGASAAAASVFNDGALYGPAVADGDWWRIVTAGFLHAGIAPHRLQHVRPVHPRHPARAGRSARRGSSASTSSRCSRARSGRCS